MATKRDTKAAAKEPAGPAATPYLTEADQANREAAAAGEAGVLFLPPPEGVTPEQLF